MSNLETISTSVVVLLIASVALVSAAALASAPLRSALVLNPYLVMKRGHVHRLLTAGWVHADVMHLLFNMMTLYFFAPDVLRALGTTRFLLLYVSAVIVAFIPSTLIHRNDPHYNSLGASGAVAAVIFSAVLLYPGLRMSLLFLPIPMPGIVFAIGYVVYSAWQSSRSRGGVNHHAHLYGALYGALLTYVFEPARVEQTVRHFF